MIKRVEKKKEKNLIVSINKYCVNKTGAELVAQGWSNVIVELDWLLGWVGNGYGWCATHFVNRHRKAENSAGSNLVVLDFDGDAQLDAFWATTTAKEWCLATYTSASHTDTEHRFRALFRLEKQLDTIAQHRGAYWLIVNRLLADLGLESLKDNCGQKPERLWYGNNALQTQVNEDAMVPAFLLEDIDYEEPTDFEATDVSPTDIQRCKWLLQEFLRPSDDDEYESYYVPVMAACAGVGSVLFDDWVEWVLKGHHGEKNENIQPFKWRGLGNYSGHTTLYSLAKKQDPNWTQRLPITLRFGAAGGAVGYRD